MKAAIATREQSPVKSLLHVDCYCMISFSCSAQYRPLL